MIFLFCFIEAAKIMEFLACWKSLENKPKHHVRALLLLCQRERENEGKNREHPHGMINIQQWRIPFMLRMKSLVHMYADYDVRHRQKVRFKCAVFSDEWNWILFCGTHCDMLWVFMWIDLWEINSKELSLPLQAVS